MMRSDVSFPNFRRSRRLFVVALAGMTAGAVFLLAWLVTGDDRRGQTWHAVVPLVVLLLAVVLLNRRWREQEDSAQGLADQNEQLRAVDKAKSDFLANVSHDLRTPLANVQMLLSGLLDTDAGGAHPRTDTRNRSSGKPGGGAIGPAGAQPAGNVAHRGAGLPAAPPALRSDGPGRRRPGTAGVGAAGTADGCPVSARTAAGRVRSRPDRIGDRQSAGKRAQVFAAGFAAAPARLAPGPLGSFCAARRGLGIFPGDEKRVFQKFYRAAGARALAGGTGLGLAICKALVGSHGGDIRVHNVAGGGAEFVFSLPALGPNGEALLPMGTVTAAPAAAAAMADTEAWR
jgi:signal transduction histidine kinase